MLGTIVKFGAIGAANDIIIHGNGDFYRSTTGGTLRYFGTGERIGPALSDGIWYVALVTKATGTVAPRFHIYNYDTSTWSHSDSPTSQANQVAAGTSRTWKLAYRR
jgi:hypothetical protein